MGAGSKARWQRSWQQSSVHGERSRGDAGLGDRVGTQLPSSALTLRRPVSCRLLSLSFLRSITKNCRFNFWAGRVFLAAAWCAVEPMGILVHQLLLSHGPALAGEEGCIAHGCGFSIICAMPSLHRRPGEGWEMLCHPISTSTVLRANEAEGTRGLTPAAARQSPCLPVPLSHLFFSVVQGT